MTLVEHTKDGQGIVDGLAVDVSEEAPDVHDKQLLRTTEWVHEDVLHRVAVSSDSQMVQEIAADIDVLNFRIARPLHNHSEGRLCRHFEHILCDRLFKALHLVSIKTKAFQTKPETRVTRIWKALAPNDLSDRRKDN